MGNHHDTGTLVLNQLRASLDGNRYSSSAICATVVVAFGGALISSVAFVVLWHRLKDVYAPRSQSQYRVEQLKAQNKLNDDSITCAERPKLLACIRESWSCKESWIIEAMGIDATLYLRTLRMVRNIFLVSTIILFCTAAPINIAFNLRAKYVANLTKRDVLMLSTPSLLSYKQMIPHVVLGWVANLVVFAIIWYNYRRASAMRQVKYASPSFHDDEFNRTAMIVDLPKSLRSSEGIKRVLSQANSQVQPCQVVITQKMKHIHSLVEEHEKLVRKYEKIMVSGKYGQGPKLLTDIQRLANKIETSRAVDVGTTNKYGFGIYDKVRDALTASRHKQNIAIMSAPPPEQIIWPNMDLTAAERQTKQLSVNTLYALLLLLWIVPSAFIGCFLSNLNRLAAIWPAFGAAMKIHPVWFAILQGISSPAITTALFATLPPLFRRFSKMQGKVTRIEREREVLRKSYAFFFSDNYFVFSIIGVIWDIVAQVLQQTELMRKHGRTITFSEVWSSLLVAQRLATAIVNISSFWVMYLSKGILEVFVTSLQPIELACRLGHKLNFVQKRTPRETVENSLPQPFQYATNFLSISFYATIALGFTTIQPSVLPIALILFFFAVPIKRYEILQMKRTNYESNGLYWPLVIDTILFALGFGNLMLLCVVWVQAGWRIAVVGAPSAATVILFKIVIYFHFETRFYYPDTNETTVKFPDVTTFRVLDRDDKNAKRYQDPAYYCTVEKPLLDYDEALKASLLAYKSSGDCNYEEVFNSIADKMTNPFEYEPYKSLTNESSHTIDASKTPYESSSTFLQSHRSSATECDLVNTDDQAPSNYHNGFYEYSVGAVRRYDSSGPIPYSPVEPYPAYQSHEGSVPQHFDEYHLDAAYKSDDEGHLLR